MKTETLTKLYQRQLNATTGLSTAEVTNWFNKVYTLLNPDSKEDKIISLEEYSSAIFAVKSKLAALIDNEQPEEGEYLSALFLDAFPQLIEQIEKDAAAIYSGDPAAKSINEVKQVYPGYFAIVAHRIAHQLHSLGVKIIPRFISEYAHRLTGVDIHPNAKIGENFFIDHGTGIVIGETSIIGNNVKLYQGVTLGALSVDKSLAGTKRHPSIGDNVVIYSGATILGGDTYVGSNTVVGGNVWITTSVPENSKVFYQAKLITEQVNNDSIIFNN